MDIIYKEPATNIFSPDFVSEKKKTDVAMAPIKDYVGYLNPNFDYAAINAGKSLAAAVQKNIVADFEKNLAYCVKHNVKCPDKMAHVSTFKIIDGYIYMSYYANVGTSAEDPNFQEARLAFCPYDNTEDMTVITIQKAGDTLDGKRVDRVYDTILMHKGNDELFIMWTASVENMYYRFYCIYNTRTHVLGEIRPNRFRVGNIENDFSISGMTNAIVENDLPVRSMWSDIGIMQKITSREENGITYYYTGAYSGNFACIIKSRDFITWEYVSTPDFESFAQWENATYLLNDRVYYFSRQSDDCKQGFLTYFDLKTEKWAKPFLIKDCQSRSDFFFYDGNLYLVHAPKDRNGIGIVMVDTENIRKSASIYVADFYESIFYPYTDIYDGELYISYTVERKHIRLSHFNLKEFLSDKNEK